MDSEIKIILPQSVVSPTDISRLTREIESLDEFFRQAAIRSGGEPQSPPRYSRLLDEVVVLNKMNLLQLGDRDTLISQLRQLGAHAPVIHMSFSVDPPGPYVQKIVSWLRQNVHAVVLVRVGLQPNIGAGCVVRTTNKSFDFSLREFFKSKKSFFAAKLHEAVAPPSPSPSPAAPELTPPQQEPTNSAPVAVATAPLGPEPVNAPIPATDPLVTVAPQQPPTEQESTVDQPAVATTTSGQPAFVEKAVLEMDADAESQPMTSDQTGIE